MNINGRITIFPEWKEKSNGEKFLIVRGSISSKKDDESYINKSVEVKFDQTQFPKSKLERLDANKCYSLEVEDGFLVVDGYTDKNGKERANINLFVSKGRLTGSKDVERKPEEVNNDDLPF